MEIKTEKRCQLIRKSINNSALVCNRNDYYDKNGCYGNTHHATDSDE